MGKVGLVETADTPNDLVGDKEDDGEDEEEKEEMGTGVDCERC